MELCRLDAGAIAESFLSFLRQEAWWREEPERWRRRALP
jgi:hypothetical protein